MASNITVCRDRIYDSIRIKYLLIIIMMIVVVLLIVLLLVVGAIFYFTQVQETEDEVVDTDTDFVPVETFQEVVEEQDSETDQGGFDIVNGWIYDVKYNYKLGIKEDGGLKASEYSADTPDQTSKWSFEPTGKGFHVGSTNGKFLKITSAGVSLSNKATGTAKIVLSPTEDGYKLSNSTKKYFIKLEKAKIRVVRNKEDASTFMIDASQYYIKNYSGDKKPSGVGGAGIISSLSEFSVSCADGVLSSFGMKKPSSNKYQYDYSCMEGDVAGGELLGSQELDESELTELRGLEGSGFKVKCEDGALANFKLLEGSDGKASYEFDCRDVPLGETEKTTTSKSVDFGIGAEDAALDPLVELGSLNCDEGHVLTGFEFTGVSEGDNYQLSGICKKIAA
jgi:hypothetical protein